jgi:uncharacterized lipoprotein YddW (UPF0748 family)
MRIKCDGNLLGSISIAFLLLATFSAAGRADVAIIDDFSAGQQAARGAWSPMTGSPPVSIARIDGKNALRMVCNFRDTQMPRASWDRKVSLDLTGRKGVQFLFRADRIASVGHFNVYFRSGAGWYTASLEAPGKAGWGLVKILKRDCGSEGQPAGWGKIDTIRISAWRGGRTDGEFQIAELAAFGSGGAIAIIRGDSAAAKAPGEAKSVQQYANVIAGLLDSIGLDYTILSDADVSAERLARMKLAILPYNPVVPDKTSRTLVEYMSRGGKLIACYCLPGDLAKQAGIRPGAHVRQKYVGQFASIAPAQGAGVQGMPDSTRQASWNINNATAIKGSSRVAAWWRDKNGKSTELAAVILSDKAAFMTHVILGDDLRNKQLLLLSLAGSLVPEIWTDASKTSLRNAGKFEPYENRLAAMKGIARAAGSSGPAHDALQRAKVLSEKAQVLQNMDRHGAAVTAAAAVRRALVDAHSLAQKPVAGEQRAFWCHNAMGVNGMTWDEAIKELADNGFNAILPNMLWGAAAYYKSDVLPVSSQVAQKGDQIALCLAACRKYNVACHVWKVNFYMGRATPKDFARKVKAAGRTQVHFDGSSIGDWLCPSHPDNQKLEIDSMVEVARKYAVAGLHFDYIRYPGDHGCFCAGCRTRFEKSISRKVANWPADVRSDAGLRTKWLDFRRLQITTVVAGVSQQARKVRQGIKISAAVFPNWPSDRDRIGQDWKLWCDRGYLDFVCPMDYTPQTGSFAQLVAKQVKWAGKVPLCPGIGASVWTPRSDPSKVIAQIRAARQAGAKGFTIFNYASQEAAELLPVLSNGITRPTNKQR